MTQGPGRPPDNNNGSATAPAPPNNGGSIEVAHGASSDILDLLNQSLAAAPERADLWMMRFEVYRSLGLKPEFVTAMQGGYENPRLRPQLDWQAIGQIWEALAPGEALPPEIVLPEEPAPSAADVAGASTQAAPELQPRNRRFSDIAIRIAGEELDALAQAYAALRARPGFFADFARNVAPLLKRPTALQPAERLAREFGGSARLFLKREDQRRVSAETEIAAAQCYIASLLDKRFLITGNDVDAHSLALASTAPHFDRKCIVIVQAADLERKSGLVAQLRGLGALVETTDGLRLLSDDPREAALRRWRQAPELSHFALSFGSGPRPYPAMVSDFQSLLGHETELQLRAQASNGHPRTFVAAVHSEADSIGFMLPQLARREVELVYVEPEPGGPEAWRPSERLRAYNGAIREHSWLRATGRITHVTIPDSQAHDCRRLAASLEDIKLSLEDARALALASLLARRSNDPRDIVVLVA